MLDKTSKTILTAALLGALSLPEARADFTRPANFESLTAASPQAPAQAPRAMNGVNLLSANEHLHREALPVQLDAALTKVKRTKYAPHTEAAKKKPGHEL